MYTSILSLTSYLTAFDCTRYTFSGVRYKKKWSDRTLSSAWKQLFQKHVKQIGSLMIFDFNSKTDTLRKESKNLFFFVTQ